MHGIPIDTELLEKMILDTGRAVLARLTTDLGNLDETVAGATWTYEHQRGEITTTIEFTRVEHTNTGLDRWVSMSPPGEIYRAEPEFDDVLEKIREKAEKRQVERGSGALRGLVLLPPRRCDAIRRIIEEPVRPVESMCARLHVHAYDEAGRESLAAGPCAAVLLALRTACPGVPISLTTSATIEPDPRRRLELVAGWTELPDLMTANQGEPGIGELCEHLLERGVGIEAGLLELSDAHAFVASGIAGRCVRVLLEPGDADPMDAVAHAASMEHVLDAAGIALEQVHHGDGIASWDVSARALARGHGMRTGLEDTIVLPDGRPAADNAELVRVSVAMMSGA